MEIRSKAEFFRLWEAGVLGNRTRLWRNLDECLVDCRRFGIQEIGFREIGKTGGGAWEKVATAQVPATVDKWRAAGRQFIMDDGAPDEHRTMQGEVCRTFRGMEGFLAVGSNLPMRQAIAAGHMRSCSYLTTLTLINKFMDPSSREDFEALMELYPDAAIEFTCFRINVGVFPGRNTIFWEIRNY